MDVTVLTDAEKEWLDTYLRPRFPELAAAYLEARQISHEVEIRRSITAAHAVRLVELASKSQTSLSENVAAMIGKMASTVPAAHDMVRSLARGRTLHARVNALVALAYLSAG